MILLDRQLLKYWHHVLSSDDYDRPGPTRFRPFDVTWSFDLTTIKLDMSHANFGDNKLAYLYRKYPIGNLSEEGCICSIKGDVVYYRRLDPFRGLIGDLVYFRELGMKTIMITGHKHYTRVHAVRAACVYPQVLARYKAPIIHEPSVAKALRRSIRQRQNKMAHETHSTSRIMNEWFEKVTTRSIADAAYNQLSSMIEA